MRILVVEDEHKIANSIRRGLEQENIAVDVAYDGASGYDFASTEEYDVMVLDRMLPEIDGIEIIKKIREAKIHTPVLLLTAKTEIHDRVEGLNSGADDYLTKPFAFTELLARIKALSRRPATSINPQITLRDLTLNTVTYEVTRSGQRIVLSSKEFALLEYLLNNANTIVSKDQIINHVWNYDANVLPNSVEVYIKHLRDKIDKPFASQPLIHTVRGFGYKIGG